MTTTTTATRPTVARLATLGAAGGALWALLPVAWAAGEPMLEGRGTASFVAGALSLWIFLVLAPALVAAGHRALRTDLGDGAGRIGRIGIPTAAAGLGAMALGNAVEVASISFGGDEVALGHAVFLVGFLVAVVGGMLTGLTVVRRRSDVLSRAGGWLLLLALPLGIGLGALGALLAPTSDAGFWAAIAVPTGIAWALLGRSLVLRFRAAAPE